MFVVVILILAVGRCGQQSSLVKRARTEVSRLKSRLRTAEQRDRPVSPPSADRVNVGGKRLRASRVGRQVTRLDLSGLPLTMTDIANCASMGFLRELNLSQTNVTDAHLATLAENTSIQVLNLTGTGITDRGLRELLSLPDLREVVVEGTAATKAGVDQFLADWNGRRPPPTIRR